MTMRIKAPVLAVAATFALTGCDLLDVDNPNNLVEESIELEAAAEGVANGALRTLADAVSNVWEGPAVVSDELYWTGSRDAWGSLDEGFISDPENEFTDAAFPTLGEAVWTAQNAVGIEMGHVTDNPGVAAFEFQLARAQFFNGMVLMITGEMQDDMTFSDKMDAGPPIGPANMYEVLDEAILNLDNAVAGFDALGEDELMIAATAVRARAKMSRAIWDVLNPTATVGGALNFSEAAVDAQTVIDAVAGDWKYTLGYTAAASTCGLCGNINNRGENQVAADIYGNDGPGAAGREDFGVTLLDPITGEPSVAVQKAMIQFGDDQYGELTIASERLMQLIVAENALAGGGGSFADAINAIRVDLDGEDPYAGGDDIGMLQFTRRANTLFMGLRLQDMYRWGLSDPLWQPASQAVTDPGVMLPITIVEIRANCHLNGQGCEG